MAGRFLAAAAVAALMISETQAAPAKEPGRVQFDASSPQVQEQARTLARKPPLAPVHGRRVVEDRSGRKQAGKTAVVTIEDRGPYVDGRTIDLPKSTAQQIGLESRAGVAPVIVAPVAVPQPDGSMRPGAGALPGPATASPPD